MSNEGMVTLTSESRTEPTLHYVSAHGLKLACFEWNAARRGTEPTLFFVHATGFHARVWDCVISLFPGRHMLALELRGHGRSAFSPFSGWQDFGSDVAAAVQTLGLTQAIGIGHSMGAHAMIHAAALWPECFARLVLIDPTLFAPESYLHAPPMPGTQHPVTSRKSQFQSAQEMFDRFVDKVPYNVFQAQALHDYCTHGLRPAPQGSGMTLCCAPSTEGHIYQTARRDLSIYTSIRALNMPVRVIRARPSDPSIVPFDTLGSPTWPGVAQEFRQGEDIHLMDRTHMLPMEDPQLTAALIARPQCDTHPL